MKIRKVYWRFILFASLLFAVIMITTWHLMVTTNVFVELDEQRLTQYPQATKFFDSEGEQVAQVYLQNRTYLPLEEMPVHVQNAFIAAEDVRFYQHHGIDLVRMLGALAANVKSGSFEQGASTITQQLIKNTHLSNEKTLIRKIKEIILALKTERLYEKDKILELYLNCVYFGNGAYGIQAAAESYFDKDVSQLSLAEASALAAALKAPSHYALHLYPDHNRARRESILSTMAEKDMISDAEMKEAKCEQLSVKSKNNGSEWEYGWYLDAVLSQAQTLLNVNADELMTMGLRIHMALDTQVQKILDELYQDSTFFPADAADGTPCQSAFIVMSADTGDVLAMIGGRNYIVRRGFNRVTQACLQPGSVLKPFAVYAPALERRIVTPATIIDDKETQYGGYSPQNFGGHYYGPVSLRQAIAQSLNIAPVELLKRMGVQTGYDSLMRFNIPVQEADKGLALAVGSLTDGASPLSICAAYASLAAQGVYRTPVLIRRIEDSNGNLLYQCEDTSKVIMQPAETYVLTNLLASTAQWGTAKQLSDLAIPIAAKTGTVGYNQEHHRDAWSAAYTPHLAMLCWMGFDHTDTQHALSDDVTGGKQPTALLKALLERLNPEPEEFTPPQDGIVYAALDTLSMQVPGEPLLAGAYTLPENTVKEIFLKGTEPTLVSDLCIMPDTPNDVVLTEGEDNYPMIRFTVLQEDTIYHLYRTHEGQSHEIAALSGAPGKVIEHTDKTAQCLYTYEYHLLPEDTRTGVYGTPTSPLTFTVLLNWNLIPWITSIE